MTRGRARRYLLVKQGYYPQVVADAGYTVFDWSTLNAGTLFQDSAKTTPASANGDVVGCWTDGVSGVDATQVTTANKPGLVLNSLNGLPTLSFDADLLATGNITISTFAVWIVFRASSLAIIYEQGVNALSNDGMWLFLSATNPIRVRRTTSIAKNGQALNDNVYRVIRSEHNGTFASLKYFANSSEIPTSGTGSDIGTGTATAPIYIGGRSGITNTLIGNIAHLCIVSPYPTAEIIANMESYINGIWGVY